MTKKEIEELKKGNCYIIKQKNVTHLGKFIKTEKNKDGELVINLLLGYFAEDGSIIALIPENEIISIDRITEDDWIKSEKIIHNKEGIC